MVPHLPLVVIYTPKEVHSRIFVTGGVSRDKSLTPYMLAKKKFVLAKPDSPFSSILGTVYVSLSAVKLPRDISQA